MFLFYIIKELYCETCDGLDLPSISCSLINCLMKSTVKLIFFILNVCLNKKINKCCWQLKINKYDNTEQFIYFTLLDY